MIGFIRQLMRRESTPGRLLIVGYLGLIAIGTVLLMLPFSNAQRGADRCSPIDALFTATSGVCVTGLIVKDTATDFSIIGKVVILILIQIGGLGYMTLATVFFLMLGRRISLRQRLMVQEQFPQLTMGRLARFIGRVFKVTVLMEGVGMVFLTIGFLRQGYLPYKALWLGLFHAVSAFCNAGFSIISGNLSAFTSDPIICLTVSTLFILGGVGFIVLSDLRNRLFLRRFHWLEIHTRLAGTVSIILILVGMLVILGLERDGVLDELSTPAKVLASYFHAATPRTAGFNTLPVGAMRPATLFFVMILMFIGASPGGTGGGVKTTTVGAVGTYIWSTLRGRRQVTLFRRTLSSEDMEKAFIVLSLGLLVVVGGSMVLLSTQSEIVGTRGPLVLLFEEMSAFGTVGLSTGSSSEPTVSLSHDFTSAGKLVIIATMLAGRIGPLTLGAAIFLRRDRERYRYSTARILVG